MLDTCVVHHIRDYLTEAEPEDYGARLDYLASCMACFLFPYDEAGRNNLINQMPSVIRSRLSQLDGERKQSGVVLTVVPKDELQ